MDSIMGEAYWSKKLKTLEYWRSEKRDADKKLAAKLEAARIKARDAQVRKAMGLRAYYLSPQKRAAFVQTLENARKAVRPGKGTSNTYTTTAAGAAAGAAAGGIKAGQNGKVVPATPVTAAQLKVAALLAPS